MGQALCGTRVQPSNNKARVFVNLLIAMMVMEILITITAFVFNDIGQGIFAAVFILVVFLSWWGLQYTTLMAYAIVSIILYVMALCYVLGKIQNGDKICGPWRDCGRFILNCFYFAWYVATSILCFFIYREFKGISFDKNPELARFFPRNRPDQPGATATHLQPQHFSSFAPNYGPIGARDQNSALQPVASPPQPVYFNPRGTFGAQPPPPQSNLSNPSSRIQAPAVRSQILAPPATSSAIMHGNSNFTAFQGRGVSIG